MHLTQRVGNSVRGKKRLSPEAREKKDASQTRWLNSLRIEQVRRVSEASGWYYLPVDDVPVEPGETFTTQDGAVYRVTDAIVNELRAIRRIA